MNTTWRFIVIEKNVLFKLKAASFKRNAVMVTSDIS